MDRARLLAEIAAAEVGTQDAVFAERRRDDYRRSRPGPGADHGPGWQLRPGSSPDAWFFHSGPWPAGRPADLPRFLEDLLAEMEATCGGADRCRWPLDQPYPIGP